MTEYSDGKQEIISSISDDGIRKKWPQIYAALAANFGIAAMGSVMAFTATWLPALRDSGGLEEFTSNQESWIGSTMNLGGIISCPLYGFLMQRFGRKSSMLATTFPFLLGWLLLGFARNFWMILAGRFITGFCGGGVSILAPIYITETADYKIRGALTSGFYLMCSLGVLYSYIIGNFASWQVQAFAGTAIPLITFTLMTFAPESPLFLLDKGRDAEVSRALCWLRGTKSSQEVEDELQMMSEALNENKNIKFHWRELFTKQTIHPISIGFALMFFQQSSAADGIKMYTVDIFQSAGSSIDSKFSAIILGIVQVIATSLAIIIIDRHGRRPLLFASSFLLAISLGVMGLYFHLKERGSTGGLDWLPLAGLLVNVSAYSIGFGPVPWLIMGELLPNRAKGFGGGIVTMASWVFSFFVTLGFKDLLELFGDDWGYWSFGILSAAGIFYIYFWVPETKGRTLNEIHATFKKFEK